MAYLKRQMTNKSKIKRFGDHPKYDIVAFISVAWFSLQTGALCFMRNSLKLLVNSLTGFIIRARLVKLQLN